jgi:hypothetical protein
LNTTLISDIENIYLAEKICPDATLVARQGRIVFMIIPAPVGIAQPNSVATSRGIVFGIGTHLFSDTTV